VSFHLWLLKKRDELVQILADPLLTFFASKKLLTLNKYNRALFVLKLCSSEFSFESACTGVKESPLTNFTNLTSVGFTVI